MGSEMATRAIRLTSQDRRTLLSCDAISDDFVADFWGGRSRAIRVELEPRPSSVACSTCGRQLVDDPEIDARVCTTHGPQDDYQTWNGSGPRYPSYNAGKRSSEREALALLRAGVSMKGVARQTGFHFNVIRRWRLQLIASGEIA
jgi:hypothetical protein